MPHDIIDNQEQKLADHIGRLLDNSERAKFAVIKQIKKITRQVGWRV
jgi:hypothetical protein